MPAVIVRKKPAKVKPENRYKPKREGDHILVVIPNYWGRAVTFEAAARRVKQESGVAVTIRTPKTKMLVYSVHPTTYCDEVHGNVMSPKGHPPIKLN